MSLLDDGPHTIVVFAQEAFDDSYDNPRHRPSTTGVEVRGCVMSPVSSARDPLTDRRIDGGYKLVTRAAPLGPWARVEFEGRSYSVEAGPHEHTTSRGTRHVVATLIPA